MKHNWLHMHYGLLADVILIIHTLFVLFIVGGLILILIGAGIGWHWIKNFWFRAGHIGAIILVTAQSWLEVICPLTTLEMYLREKAGQTIHSEPFIAYWLHKLLYYNLPLWVFSISYSLFGLVLVLTWICIPPHQPWRKTKQ